MQAHDEAGGVVMLELDIEMVAQVVSTTQLCLAFNCIADISFFDAT